MALVSGQWTMSNGRSVRRIDKVDSDAAPATSTAQCRYRVRSDYELRVQLVFHFIGVTILTLLTDFVGRKKEKEQKSTAGN